MIPRLWPGKTCILIGGGPSLTHADVNAVRGRARVMAINDAYRLAPWADVLYAADARWIDWHDGVPAFAGLKCSIAAFPNQPPATTRADWYVLPNAGGCGGLELNPAKGLRTGGNSGYQAINLAVHLGVARIVLLGYDLCDDGVQSHWFGEHPDGRPPIYPAMIAAFNTLTEPLRVLGIDIVNCSRRTALAAFPCRSLEAVLLERAA